MIAVDTSVVVAGLSPWHEHHESCREALDGRPRIVGHVLLETFSVLTRLPVPFRMPAAIVSELLMADFAEPPLTMSADHLRRFVVGLAEWNVRGGATYDALIGATAEATGATLLTLDARALRTYAVVGADARVVARRSP